MTMDEDELATAWAVFSTEASALVAADPETMSAELLDRLEALSDPLIHIVGHCESNEAGVALLRHALSSDPRTDAGGLGSEARRRLSEQIIAGLHAQRLRVAMPQGEPPLRAIGRATLIGSALLTEAERTHEAVLVPELAIAAGAGNELWETDCDTLVQLTADMPRGQYLALKVAGDSMEPMLHSGDVVLLRLGSDPVVGRIVVARIPDHGYVVKEVGRVTVDAIELLSLNPSFEPVVVPPASGTVLGTVLLRWCPHGSTTALQRGKPRPMI